MDSIIFDLDGTLWDSRDVVVNAWNDVLKKYKEINKTLTKEDFKGVMGLQIKEIGMRFFPHLEDNMQQKILKECCEIESQYLTEQGGRLYEKLEETLEILSKKYKLLIVSNCQSAYMQSFYNYHKLQRYFVDFENPGRTGLPKGENIKLVIERNNLTNSVYVGDTEGDQKAARFAGVPFVFASYGFGEVSHFDYEINSFSGLLELF